MSKKLKKPELRVRRAFTNERPILELFADAYRIYFTEKKMCVLRMFDIH